MAARPDFLQQALFERSQLGKGWLIRTKESIH
jgi:hypothetical protein